uniref:(northern house mosquito) hypothetical protein n=1 Tax=Culex pipiens TaxID=7175 RepID=A0A8D8PJ62_CULPI
MKIPSSLMERSHTSDFKAVVVVVAPVFRQPGTTSRTHTHTHCSLVASHSHAPVAGKPKRDGASASPVCGGEFSWRVRGDAAARDVCRVRDAQAKRKRCFFVERTKTVIFTFERV